MNTPAPASPPPDPPDLPGLWRAARACEAAGDYPQAWRLLQRCQALTNAATPPALASSLRAGLWRLNPLWWANIQHGGVALRRCRAEDADFFRRCFGDASFRQQFRRGQPWRGDLALALKKAGQEPPVASGLLMWVVQSATRGAIGLASLSSIDTHNRRVELSVGFPGEVPATLGIKTTLMMLHFALVLMPFNKVCAYVYEDNPAALHNAIRLGFVHEGRLADHFHLPGQGFVSVNQIGLTRAQLHGHAGLQRLARRKIGQDWQIA